MPPLFTHPGLLLALLSLPLLSILTFLAARRRQRALSQMAGLIGSVILSRRKPSFLARLCVSLGLTALALGMAGPRWGRDWSLSAAPGRDLILVIDVSRSMYAEAPSRIDRACRAVLDLTDALRSRGGQRVGLVLFAGKPRLVCPLTHDLDHVRECVEAIDPGTPDATLGSGTRIGAALSLAVESFDGRSAQARDIILLSDGDDPAFDGEWQGGRNRARAEGIPVHVVAVGDVNEGHRIPTGSGWLAHDGVEVRTRRQDAALRGIALPTGGQLYTAEAKTFPLGDAYLSLRAGAVGEESPDALPLLRQRQGWFLLPAFVLLCLSLLLAPRGRGS